MARGAAGLVALTLFSCALVASGQDALRAVGLPLSIRGVVHRESFAGCGQSWSSDVAVSTVSLEIDRRGRAALAIHTQVDEEHGGVLTLSPEPGRYHGAESRSLDLTWSGRARIREGRVVIALRALVESAPVPGSASGIVVTNRSTAPAELICTREEHAIFAATRPISTDAEPEVARRAIFSCAFEPREHEPPLPRPVDDSLTMPFFLDVDAGVTTDARYGGYVTVPADSLVAREPAG
jgi:hypothetical protein